MASPTLAPQPEPSRRRKRRGRARFDLQAEIATGGMGTVYRAFDRELNRTVAVKLLRAELVPDLGNLLRLKRELVLASRVSDEHVVRVHDIGEIDGRALISMDWVDGENLAQFLRRVHALPPSQVLSFATQIAQALCAIHAANVIHRDLKPGNLLIRRDGAILVSDFGLARSALPQDFALTQPGDLGGTPSYMAPEQLAGLPADARSDLYTFGIILLEMLTGTTALETLAPLRLRILAAEAGKHLRSMELRSLATLELVIRRCVCLDRTERYASADLVLHDLATSRIQPATQARPGGRLIRRLFQFRSSRIGWALVLVLLAASGYIIWRHNVYRAAEAERLYLEAMSYITAQSGETELRQAVERLHEVVVRRPNHTAAVRAQIDTLIHLYERTRDPQWLQNAANALSTAPAIGLTADERILFRSRIELNQGLFQRVIDALQNASALRSRSEQANRLLGRAFAASGQIDAALQAYAAAIRISPESWMGHNDLGVAFISLGRLKDARKEFVRVIELQPQSPIGYQNLGSALFDDGLFAEARKNFEIGLQLVPSAAAYYNLGLVSFFSREYAISTTFFEKAIEMRPSSDLYAAALADSLRHLHRLEGARQNYGRALALLQELSEKRPLTVEEQSRRAIYLARLGDLNAADSLLRAFSPGLKSKDLSYARGIVAMLEGRSQTANRHLKDAERYGCPHNLIDLNPDFDDLPQ